MQITHLNVQTFKSLYSLEARFGPLSVVTGPNGSGKSNLVDALVFLADTYQHGLEIAVSRAGGYENIAHRKTRRAKKAISFEVEISLSAEDLSEGRGRYIFRRLEEGLPETLNLTIKHGFSFQASSQKVISDFDITHEWFEILEADGRSLARVDVRNGEIAVESLQRPGSLKRGQLVDLARPFLDKDFSWERWAGRVPSSTQLAVNVFRYLNVFTFLSEHVSTVRVFQLSPHLSRTSGVATPNAELGQHGENLPGAADNLRRSNPSAWKQVELAMRSVLPDLQTIAVVPTEDRRLAIQFRERGIGRAWNANEVSDGTIQTFALLVALFDYRTSMLVIEEPENAIHPWILRQIVQLAGETDRQMLFTTHSPVLLDYVDPELVWLMWMRDGQSYMRKFISLDPDLADGLTSGKLSIFEIYDTGYFNETAPRGLGNSSEEDQE